MRFSKGTRPKFVVITVVIGLVVALCAGLLIAYSQNKHHEQVAAEKQQLIYKYEQAADEKAKNDALAEASVKVDQLKHYINSVSTDTVDTAELTSQINSIISQNSDIIFGVSIKYLNTGADYDYGNTGAMTAASVTKVLTAVDYLKQVELGKKSLETVMSNGKTAKTNMEDMIVISDNDAWHILNEDLTYAQLQDYAQSIGLASYDYTDNTISSHDTAQLFGSLYQRKLINESNSQLLLSYMERANYRDLIIPAVPEHDTVYHKAGEYQTHLNDAAIITNDTNAIVLSIYTTSKGTYSKSRVTQLMQQITTPTITTFHLN